LLTEECRRIKDCTDVSSAFRERRAVRQPVLARSKSATDSLLLKDWFNMRVESKGLGGSSPVRSSSQAADCASELRRLNRLATTPASGPPGWSNGRSECTPDGSRRSRLSAPPHRYSLPFYQAALISSGFYPISVSLTVKRSTYSRTRRILPFSSSKIKQYSLR
jgi:hypothetical protein